jgi:ABC-type transporter Mla MlaB component
VYSVTTRDDASVSLSGEVARSDLVEVRASIERLVEAHDAPRVVVYLKDLKSYNSQILSLCLCLIRKAKSLDIELEFKEPPQKLFDMARVGGLEFIFSH